MPVYYFDTSAALKRYRSEKGSDVVKELYDGLKSGESLITSHFTCLEVESAAARARKGKVLGDEAYDKMLGAFARDLDEYLLTMPISSALLNEATDIAKRYALRAGDAVQLASAERVRGVVREFVLVASDRELLEAAETAGINRLNPETDKAKEQISLWRK